MNSPSSPLIGTAIAFAYLGGAAFLAAGIYLSIRRGRLHPLLLLCVSALSFSWIEAPYDWAMNAQFPPAIPRMPSWWPLNMTWGGLPSPVPVGYMSYFAMPAVIASAVAGRLHRRLGWRRPPTLLTTGLVTGFCWAAPNTHRPGGHLSFGQGIHFCLGSALARLEARIAFEEMLDRWPQWEVDYAGAQRARTSSVRGWSKLPVRTR